MEEVPSDEEINLKDPKYDVEAEIVPAVQTAAPREVEYYFISAQMYYRIIDRCCFLL